MTRPARWHWLLLLPGVLGCLAQPTPTLSEPIAIPASTFGRPQIDAVDGPAKIIAPAKVVHFGRTIFEGKIDVNPTLDRIRAGDSLNHANDGAVFRNFEGRLPKQKDREYYREFVHQMMGLPFPGPQRVIIGKGGEVYYTGDHYDSFTRVR